METIPLQIRKARVGDLEALIQIENAAFTTDRLSGRSFRRLVASRSAELLVAERHGRVLGYCVVLTRLGSRSGRLYSIAIAPVASGAGVARRLLEAAEDAAAQRGCGELRLEVRKDNRRALDLYERSGFEKFGHIADYYADGMEAWRYRKRVGDEAADISGRKAGDSTT